MINNPDFENAYGWNPANSNYKEGNESIGTIYLTGAGFDRRPFRGVGVDSQFGWEEMVWYKQPTRTQDFSFSNIDDIRVGLVARCEINIKYLNYQDYIDLRRIIARERRFKVRFFNVDSGKWIDRDMYCSENSRSKLFTLKQSLVGVVDCVIKFVGTNLDVETIVGSDNEHETVGKNYIKYKNNGVEVTSLNEKGITQATQVVIASGANLSIPSGENHFSHWKTSSGQKYFPSQSITLWESLDLEAVWE